MRTRGLKPYIIEHGIVYDHRVPMRTRGLKPVSATANANKSDRVPMRTRGLKQNIRPVEVLVCESRSYADARIETRKMT